MTPSAGRFAYNHEYILKLIDELKATVKYCRYREKSLFY